MDFRSKLIDIGLQVAGVVFGIGLLWYSFSHLHTKFHLPAPLQNTFDAVRSPVVVRQTNTITMTEVIPYPNEQDIGTFPKITATSINPFTKTTTASIVPAVPVMTVLRNGDKTIELVLQSPLKTTTRYLVTITNPETKGNYQWQFTTGQVAVNSKLVPAVSRLKEQLPYNDPNGQFSVYYAAQTDTYFIAIHDDERSVDDKNAALAWLRSLGVTDATSLQIVWQPVTGL